MSLNRSKHALYFALLETLNQEGCPICTLVLNATQRYFAHLVYERVNDLGVRQELRSALGYCPVHGEMLRQAQNALGVAIIYRDLLNSLIYAIREKEKLVNTPRRWRLGGSREAVIPSAQEACPACVLTRENEVIYIDTFLKYWSEEDLQAEFRSSSGLCMPHLRLLVDRSNESVQMVDILHSQIEAWQQLLGELDEFIRKQDYRFSNEPIGREGSSWSRAIDLVSGLWNLPGEETD